MLAWQLAFQELPNISVGTIMVTAMMVIAIMIMVMVSTITTRVDEMTGGREMTKPLPGLIRHAGFKRATSRPAGIVF